MISTAIRSTTAQVGADRIRTGVTGLGTSYRYVLRGVKAYVPHRGLSEQIPSFISGDELGWRLAGLADGEGCFIIAPRPHKRSFYCSFVIGLRADDSEFLRLMQVSTGVGNFYEVRTTENTLARRPGTRPQVRWDVSKRLDCLALISLFDQYPPLSKKAGEYLIWREAVFAWGAKNWPLMSALWRELKESRAFPDVNHHFTGAA